MKDTSPKVRRLQFDMMMNLGVNRRIELAAEMFMAARQLMRRSFPSDISASEAKRRMYRKTYGEDLPEDFFNGQDKDA